MFLGKIDTIFQWPLILILQKSGLSTSLVIWQKLRFNLNLNFLSRLFGIVRFSITPLFTYSCSILILLLYQDILYIFLSINNKYAYFRSCCIWSITILTHCTHFALVLISLKLYIKNRTINNRHFRWNHK